MLDVPRLSPRIQPKTLLYDNFRMGVCRQGDSTEIKQLRDCQNAVMDRFGFRKRPGITKKGTTIGTVKVTGLGDAQIAGDLYHFCVTNRTLKKWKVGTDSDWSDTDKTTLTSALNTAIKSFPFKTGASVDSGTFDAGSSTRTLIDAAKSWTVDGYTGYLVVIDGGTNNGQTKLIVGNEADRLYVNEPFDEAIDATSTYDIYAVDWQACFANGTEDPWYYDGTSSHDITMPGASATAFRDIEVHDQRLWGTFRNQIWFSDEGNGNQFSQNSMIPYNTTDRWVLRVQELNEQLVAYSENSFGIVTGKNGIYGLQMRSNTVGLYAYNSLATGSELQFFLSKCGVEVVNRFENDVTAKVTPISENIAPWLAEHSAAELQAACGVVHGNYYYLTIPDGSLFYTYRYDILRSDPFSPDPDKQKWDRYLGWPANVMAVMDGDLYIGTNSPGSAEYVYQALSGDSDDGSAISLVVQTRDEDFRYPDADKMFDKVQVFAEASIDAIEYAFSYRIDQDSSWTSLGTLYSDNDLGRIPARGTLTLSGLPTAAESFDINATTVTAVASGATTDEFNIGTDADTTADNIVAAVNAGSEAANVRAYKGGEGEVIFEWIATGTKGSTVVFTESMTNTTITGSGYLTGPSKRGHKTFDLYKRGRTLAIKVTRSDTLSEDEGEIIKIGVHYHIDQRE